MQTWAAEALPPRLSSWNCSGLCKCWVSGLWLLTRSCTSMGTLLWVSSCAESRTWLSGRGFCTMLRSWCRHPVPTVIRGLGRPSCGSPLQNLCFCLHPHGSRPPGKASGDALQGWQLHPSRDGPSMVENVHRNAPGAIGTCLHAQVPQNLLKPTLRQPVRSSGDGVSASSRMPRSAPPCHTQGRTILLTKGLFKMPPAFLIPI